jgi:hypothetical protein
MYHFCNSFSVSSKGERRQRVKTRLFYFQVICHFENIFGLELKTITNDPACIDAVLEKVETLLTAASQADFDIFDQKFELSWQELLGSIHYQVSKLEIEAIHSIDECFKLLG